MSYTYQDITIRQLEDHDAMPYDLLLLADPSKHLVDEYLKQSEIFIASIDEKTIGVFVLYPLMKDSVEIKNLAVKATYQGKGIGKMMIEYAIKLASSKNKKSIYIGTADSSIGQLKLYKKLGFKVNTIINDFFTKNYPEPIFENGIQGRNMVMLVRPL